MMFTTHIAALARSSATLLRPPLFFPFLDTTIIPWISITEWSGVANLHRGGYDSWCQQESLPDRLCQTPHPGAPFITPCRLLAGLPFSEQNIHFLHSPIIIYYTKLTYINIYYAINITFNCICQVHKNCLACYPHSWNGRTPQPAQGQTWYQNIA
ncbi:hypothetical protein ES703_35540 [subsurface metagenome]